MIDILNDLSVISKIPFLTLHKLADQIELCIGSCIFDTKAQHEVLTTIDIGIGTLNILNDEAAVKYKFIPSKSLEAAVNKVIENNENPLINILDEALSKRVEKAYRGFL